MPPTKDFEQTVRARLLRSAGFRKAVLQEAIDGLLAGDVDTGKALLRDYINGTMGFERLGELTHIPAKSLTRMLGPKGNPQARNLFDVIDHLQRAEGVRFHVSVKEQIQESSRLTSSELSDLPRECSQPAAPDGPRSRVGE